VGVGSAASNRLYVVRREAGDEPLRLEPRALRFGPFELDPRTGELRRSGLKVKLQMQPARVLALLASQPGQLLTREQIQQEVWCDGTFVDYDQSLNFCIRQIRSALGDHADTPRFVETLPRRGYRFIAPVTLVEDTAEELGGAQGTRIPPQAALPLAEEARLADTKPASRPIRWLLPALGTIALASTAAAGYLALRPPRTAPAFERVTFRRGVLHSARYAPDGQIVYAAAWEGGPERIYGVRAGSADSRPVEAGPGLVVGASRLGEIAFLTRNDGRGRTLRRAPLAGGPDKPVLENVRTADWTPDGSRFAVARSSETGVSKIEFPIGNVLGEARFPTHLRVSPAQDRVAFLEHPVFGDDRGRVVVMDLDGTRRVLSDDWASAQGLVWSPKGREVWFTAARTGADSALHAVTLDGTLRTLVPALGRLVIHDVAPDGRVLLGRTSLRFEIRFGDVRTGAERDLSWFDISGLVALSKAGDKALFFESGEGGGPDYSVYLRETDGSVPIRVGSGRAVALSPDEKWVMTIPIKDGSRLELLPTGPGEVRELREDGLARYVWGGWLPDGKRIFITAVSESGALRTYLKELPDGKLQPITPEGTGVFRNAFAPDGSGFVADCGDEVCLYPLDGGEPKPIPGLAQGTQVVGWDPSGRSVFVANTCRRPVQVDRLDLGSGKRTLWRELQPADLGGVHGCMQVDVADAGTAYAYSFARTLSDLYVVEGLQ